MRFVLPLLALCAFSSAPLRADMFDITLTGVFGSPSGSGTFTTDGICLTCMPVAPFPGLLSLTINIGRDSGMNAFDISDEVDLFADYLRPENTLLYNGLNSETGDLLFMDGDHGDQWTLRQAGDGLVAAGTYSVTPTPVPEPRSLFLLMPTVALVGLRWRHQFSTSTLP